jgi:hypothetical protein
VLDPISIEVFDPKTTDQLQPQSHAKNGGKLGKLTIEALSSALRCASGSGGKANSLSRWAGVVFFSLSLLRSLSCLGIFSDSIISVQEWFDN